MVKNSSVQRLQQQQPKIPKQRSVPSPVHPSRWSAPHMAALATALCLLAVWYSSAHSATNIISSSGSSSSCTAPRPTSDALRPFCFVPKDTISTAAQQVLQQRAVKAQGSRREQPLSVVTQAQAEYDAMTAPISEAAVKKYLQDVTSEVVAGVPTFTATPKGFDKAASSSKLLVYLHGGAYMKGSCDKLWQVTAPTSQLSGLRVLCADYRLAPQHPFPAGLNDALAVYRALVTTKGFSPSSIGLIGDSAGGGLVLALLQRLQQEGLGLPGAVGLMSPWSDLRKVGDTHTTLTGIDPVLQYEQNLAGPALDYVGGDASRLGDPLVSPLVAEYGNGRPFPPTLIQVGLRDSFLSSSVLLYRKMLAGGLKAIVLSPWEAMWHVFQATEIPEAQAAAQELAQFFKQHLK